MKKYLYIFFVLTSFEFSYSQENSANNLFSLPYFMNPSFYSVNDIGKVGFLFQTETQSIGSQQERRLVFGSYNFESNSFTLGADINSNTYKSTGFNETKVGLHYIYNLYLDRQWMFNPSISLNFVSRQFQPGSVYLEDQINIITGEIDLNSADPLLPLVKNRQYLSIGAGFVLHNSYNHMIGFSIKNINSPNQSLVEGQIDKIKFYTSIQHQVLFDLNKFKQSSLLSTYSYLRLFNSVSKYGTNFRFDTQQRLDLNDFYFSLNQQFNNAENFEFHRLGLGAGIYSGSIEYGFTYNFNFSNINSVSFKTLELFVSFDLSPFAGKYRGDRSPFRHF